MNKYKDTDLREALHRKYADEPQLPADFMAGMERRMEQAGDNTAESGGKTDGDKRRPLWRWVAVAACFLLVAGVGVNYLFEEPAATSDVTLAKTEQHQKQQTTAPEVTPEATPKPSPKPAPKRRTERTNMPVKQCTPDVQAVTPQESASMEPDPNIHYAALTTTVDSVPYKDPARVDEFIAKMAEYNKVKEGELTCSAANDSSVVGAVYVFPDNKEIDVFSRLLQVACWYDSKTPGYHLNFSQQQFFFELQDMRRQLQYRWIAERINGRILFYSTQAPLGVKESSACYQQYRDELMYQNSINSKTKKI